MKRPKSVTVAKPKTITSSECRRLLDALIPELVEEFALQNWEIRYGFARALRLSDGSASAAVVYLQSDYLRAFIRIDLRACGDRAGVIQSVRHEFVHILLAPFDLLRESIALMKLTAPHAATLDRLAVLVTEQSVAQVERLLERLKKR